MDIDLDVEVRLAQSGQHEAFIRMVKKVEIRMYNIAKAILKNDEDCADAMQEAILKAYKSIKSIRQPKFFNTWLFRILINECNSILRKRLDSVTVDELPQLTDHSSQDDHIDLWDAIWRLEEVSRTIVILHYFQDKSLRQIADLMETSEGAVKSRLHRSRNILNKWLTDSMERKLNYEPSRFGQ